MVQHFAAASRSLQFSSPEQQSSANTSIASSTMDVDTTPEKEQQAIFEVAAREAPPQPQPIFQPAPFAASFFLDQQQAQAQTGFNGFENYDFFSNFEGGHQNQQQTLETPFWETGSFDQASWNTTSNPDNEQTFF